MPVSTPDPFTLLEFENPYDVEGRLSIADLLPKSRSRCGIYMFALANGLFYIGQSRDAAKRYAQHRKKYDNITRFAFRHVERQDLDEIEQTLIHQAQASGVPLTNKEFVADVRGVTDFDLLVSPEERAAWLKNPRMFDADQVRVNSESQRMRFAREYEQFSAHELAPEAIALLQTYVWESVPAFRRTEMSFWSLTCMPSTNRNAWPRLACVNIHLMETFVIGFHKKNPQTMWSFVNVSKSVLLDRYKTQSAFETKYPNVIFRDAWYRSVANDGATLHAESSGMHQLLRDPAVLNAARHLNLRLMKKGATTLFSRYHCFLLADQVVESGRPSEKEPTLWSAMKKRAEGLLGRES